MVVAASAVGLGRVQLPRQSDDDEGEDEDDHGTEGGRGEERAKEQEREKKGEKERCARSNTETTPDFEPRMDLTLLVYPSLYPPLRPAVPFDLPVPLSAYTLS